MEEQDPNALIQMCIEHYFERKGNPEEVQPIVNFLTSRHGNLAFFCSFLHDCPKEGQLGVWISYKLIREVLAKRGSLISPESLQGSFIGLLNETISLAALLTQAGWNAALSEASLALGLTYRLFFECFAREQGGITPPFPMFFDEAMKEIEGTDQHYILKLKCMTSIIEIFSKPDHRLKCLSPMDHTSRQDAFRKQQLFGYFEEACQCVAMRSPIDPVTNFGLEFLFACLKYDHAMNDDTLTWNDLERYQFHVSDALLGLCLQQNIPRALFAIYQASLDNEAQQQLALRVLMYFSSSATSSISARHMGKDGNFVRDRISYLAFITENMTHILNGAINPRNTKDIARLLGKVAFLIPVCHFISLGAPAYNFFTACYQFSERMWGSMREEEVKVGCMYMLKFWEKIGDVIPAVRDTLPQEFKDMFPGAFKAYIAGLLAAAPESPQEFRSVFPDLEMLIDDMTPLWKVVSMVQPQAIEYISGLIVEKATILSQMTAEAPVIAHQLTLLLLVAAAKMKDKLCYSEVGYQDHMAVLITAVFKYVAITNPVLEGLASGMAPCIDSLEQALTLFTVHFKRNFLSDQVSSEVQMRFFNGVYEKCEVANSRKDAFDLFVNRFLMDLKFLNGAGFPIVLQKILEFLEQLLSSNVERGDIKKMASENPLLQQLVQRNGSLVFSLGSEAEIESANKFFPLLNRIYARAMKTREEWAQFLAYFDAGFAELARSGYADSTHVFVFFREIYGVLYGISGAVDFCYVFKWFMERHVDDTLQCIGAQGGNDKIVHAIYRTWYMLCSNKGRKLLLDARSADGIILFRNSIRICEAIMEAGGVENEHKSAWICKIVKPSITEGYANFGVMKYFEDNSFDVMVAMFFQVVRMSGFDMLHNNGILTVLSTCNWLIVNATEMIGIEDRIPLILEILRGTLLRFHYTEQIDNKSRLRNNDQLKILFDTLYQLMMKLAEVGHSDWSVFHRHFLTILECFSSTALDVPLEDCGALPLCFIIQKDTGFAENVVGAIVESFDEEDRPGVAALINEVFAEGARVEDSSKVSRFRSKLYELKKGFARYGIHLSDIACFREMIMG